MHRTHSLRWLACVVLSACTSAAPPSVAATPATPATPAKPFVPPTLVDPEGKAPRDPAHVETPPANAVAAP